MKESSNVYRTAGMVMIITIIYRILGFLREMQIAYFLGAGEKADAYITAFSVPSIIIEVLALGAITSAIIPVASKYAAKNELDELNEIGNITSSVTLVVASIATVVAMIFAQQLVGMLAPGFTSDKLTLTTHLTRIMLPCMVFSGLYGISKAMLNTYNHFFMPAFANVVYNFILIVVAFVGFKHIGIDIFAYAVVLGTIAQWVLQKIQLKKMGYKYKFHIDLKNKDIKLIFKLMVPILIASIVAQLNFIVDKAVASNISDGSISALNYANKLVQLPLGIFVGAIITTMLPNMSRCAATGSSKDFNNFVNKAFNMLLIFMVPSSIALMFLNVPLINTLFQGKAFTIQDTMVTANVLFYYSIGTSFVAISQLFANAFYAHQDTKTTLYVNIFSVCLNIILNLTLSRFMGTNGIALATSISSVFGCFLMYFILKKRCGVKIKLGAKEYLKFALSIIVVIILCSTFTHMYMVKLIALNKLLKLSIIMAFAIFTMLVYFAILTVSDFQGVGEAKNLILKKLMKK